MALVEYKTKRRLTETPEPSGGKSKSNKLQFVVQKHAASRLHYDFRLELNGVLVSWAIPKGPSMDHEAKRLAMKVEDHPFDYKDFEGIIPEGNYGAGTVIIWDQGIYEPVNSTADKKEQEKILAKQLHSKEGLKFVLHGKKLKGEFHLFPAKSFGENSWLLWKGKDRYVTDKDISLKEKSVVSGKTLEQVASSRSAKKWISNRSSDGKEKNKIGGNNKISSGKRKKKISAKQVLYFYFTCDTFNHTTFYDQSKVSCCCVVPVAIIQD
jgi:bifunctional non-homologous end joining protein LigD